MTGSIAATGIMHVVLELQVKLRLPRRSTTIVMTRAARRFVTPESFADTVADAVYSDWNDLPPGESHVSLADASSVILIAPCTFSTLGKVAGGIADNLLTSVVSSALCPIILVPSMSASAWFKPVTQRNVCSLERDGVVVVEPRVGTSIRTGLHEVGSMGDFRRPLISALLSAGADQSRRRTDEMEGE